MNYSLPKTVYVDGQQKKIRYDFRAILDIIELLNDPELNNADKAQGLIEIFYVDPESIIDYESAIKECFAFIDQGGKKEQKSGPKLVDWEQDFEFIVAPINRVLGLDCRGIDYDYENSTGGLHWWTFLSAYMEIGSECLFSQIVSIRDKQARGKKLEKYEREWYNKNRNLVDLRHTYTEAEDELIRQWSGGELNG